MVFGGLIGRDETGVRARLPAFAKKLWSASQDEWEREVGFVEGLFRRFRTSVSPELVPETILKGGQ